MNTTDYEETTTALSQETTMKIAELNACALRFLLFVMMVTIRFDEKLELRMIDSAIGHPRM
jgi:hypothetical protein